ncbi:MAG: hypothetical protein GY789_12540 [Hyphomicrobiales bacterium]|nr:hypothetical protein [Hyphomicrobiales bacterium]
MTNNLDPIRTSLVDSQIWHETPVWKCVVERAGGGLRAVGFDRNSEDLLVISANGQSVVDSSTGASMFRNRESDGYDADQLKGSRLDRPQDTAFDVAGIDGGALRTCTHDGWHAQAFQLAWPEAHYVLHPPGASIYNLRSHMQQYQKDAIYFLLAREIGDVWAYGFSWSGRTLVLATNSDIKIWQRQI